jgi:nucleoside-diphosphate-sugar epimerase
MRVALVGGSGFVGQALSHVLKDRGDEVVVFDVNPPPHKVLDSLHAYVKGDVTDLDDLVAFLDNYGPEVVIHLASWGMSGWPMLSKRCEQINIGGVEALIEAMRQTDTEALIYTSTYNVVYGGEEIAGGDESLPYYPVEQHSDIYSASKAIAEQMALAANSPNLRVLSLRPAAIYGDGEERHFPRIIKHIDSGVFAFRIGSESIVDWVHVDNLTSAYICAIDKLAGQFNFRKSPCGQSFFISDGTPIDNFEFLNPIVKARGAEVPKLVVPVVLALAVAWVCELGWRLFGIEPFLTRAEVLKVGRTHCFSIDKARRELGYDPSITSEEGASFMARAHTLERDVSAPNYFRLASWKVWLGVNLGMSGLYFAAYHDAASHGLVMTQVHRLGLFLFQSQANLQLLFQVAVGIHALEAVYSFVLTASLGVATPLRLLWAVQTFFLGYGALNMLLARQKAISKRRF